MMLIVCANLSNLLLARSGQPPKRNCDSHGAGGGRCRLIRQMLTESLALSFCGAVLGLLLAFAGTRALSLERSKYSASRTFKSMASRWDLHCSSRSLTGVIFGLRPRCKFRRLKLHDVLKDANRGSSRCRGHAWIRNGLVVSEIGLACVLLVGAGLLIRSFLRVMDVDLGFRPERAAALRIDPPFRLLISGTELFIR